MRARRDLAAPQRSNVTEYPWQASVRSVGGWPTCPGYARTEGAAQTPEGASGLAEAHPAAGGPGRLPTVHACSRWPILRWGSARIAKPVDPSGGATLTHRDRSRIGDRNHVLAPNHIPWWPNIWSCGSQMRHSVREKHMIPGLSNPRILFGLCQKLSGRG